MSYIKFIDEEGNLLSVGSTSEIRQGSTVTGVTISVPNAVETQPITEEEYNQVIDAIE